jgi:hypothetical protein
LGLSYKDELWLAFEFAVFSGRLKLFEQYHRGKVYRSSRSWPKAMTEEIDSTPQVFGKTLVVRMPL